MPATTAVPSPRITSATSPRGDAPSVARIAISRPPLRSLPHQRGPVQHDADGRPLSLALGHVDQKSLAVGSGLRSSGYTRARRKGQPLRHATHEGVTGCANWRGESCGSTWSRVEDDLVADAPPQPVAVIRDLPVALAE